VREIRTSIFDLHTTGDAGDAALRRGLFDAATEAAEGNGVSPSVRDRSGDDGHPPCR
jgi:hypothetical protein